MITYSEFLEQINIIPESEFNDVIESLPDCDINDVEFDSYKGLNLSNTKVMPHYNKISESIKNKMDLYEKENNIIITKLNDGDYILEYYN